MENNYIKIWMLLFPLYISSCANKPKETAVAQPAESMAGKARHCVAPPSRSDAFRTAGTGVVDGQRKDRKDSVKMLWIPGGAYRMGSNDFPDAKPVHTVTVSGFWMDEHEVPMRSMMVS